VSLTIEELRELLITLDQTSISELTLKADNFELTVRRDRFSGSGVDAIVPASPAVETTPTAVFPAPVATPTPIALPTPVAPPPPSPLEKKWVEITSPMVGTFYSAPAPGEPPFVNIGDRIRAGQPVCIVEAMKLMNEIEADISGEIIEILVENAQPVEYGQPLMRVNPT